MFDSLPSGVGQTTCKANASLPPVGQSLWNPFTLKFHDDRLETRYHTESLTHRLGHEQFAYFFGIIAGLVNLEGSVGWLQFWWRCTCFIQAPFLGYLTMRKRDFYMKWRTYITVYVMASTMVYHFVREAGLPPPGSTMVDILSRLSKSPMCLFPIASVFFPLVFRYMFLYSFPYMMGGLYWSKTFCSSCGAGAGADYAPVFNVFSGFNWNVVSVLSFNSFGVAFPPKLDCGAVMMFLQMLGGILIPGYFVYVAEVGFRASFLRQIMGEGEKARIEALKNDCRAWSVWVLFGLILLTYLIL
ncbi:hypothetical protein BSKO_05487 [Bryopsis sp. KO-2023]|nr:hypothetical protein BSKO_05487 [Bryopsis sp. KO-2023]